MNFLYFIYSEQQCLTNLNKQFVRETAVLVRRPLFLGIIRRRIVPLAHSSEHVRLCRCTIQTQIPFRKIRQIRIFTFSAAVQHSQCLAENFRPEIPVYLSGKLRDVRKRRNKFLRIIGKSSFFLGRTFPFILGKLNVPTAFFLIEFPLGGKICHFTRIKKSTGYNRHLYL